MVASMITEIALSLLHLEQLSAPLSLLKNREIAALTTSEPPRSPPTAINPPAQKLDPAQLKAAFDREDLSSAVRQVELGWKFQYEDYFQGKLTSQYLSLDEIQQRLYQLQQRTGKSTALIYAVPGATQLDILMVPPDGKPVHRRITAADRASLTKTIQTFRIGVVNPESQPQDYLPAAQQLYQWIIAPIVPDLREHKIDTLIFCMGTGLRSLPLAALHDGKQFLVEQYNLALIPAFNLLDHRPAVLAGTQVLAMGASTFKDREALPAVELELSTITRDRWPGRSLLNQDFTLEKLQAERSRTAFGIIHLATHADISAQSAQDSYLQFWDRPFRLTQMRNLNFRAPVVQLLVLSACRTALGSPQAELGFAGLSVQSGAKATIASLWSVNDGGTLVLMSEFYRHLSTAKIKVEALRATQIAMLKGDVTLSSAIARPGSAPLPPTLVAFSDTKLSHPYYWAAFTLIGNPW
jgi:CHAT domain-containing protein